MTADDALKLVERALAEQGVKPLSPMQAALLQQAWDDRSQYRSVKLTIERNRNS